MSFFAKATEEAKVAEESGDVIFGGSDKYESGAYEMIVKHAFVEVSKGGAQALTVCLKPINGQGREHTEKFWFLSSTEKGNKPYYVDRSGAKQQLMGFTLANHLCCLGYGKPMSKLADPEDKTLMLYNYEAKKEVPTPVKMVTELLGAKVLVGMLKKKYNKRVKDSDGQYVDSADTYETNEVDKFFRLSDKATYLELLNKTETGVFLNTWLKKYEGVVVDKSKAVDNGSAGAPALGAPAIAESSDDAMFDDI